MRAALLALSLGLVACRGGGGPRAIAVAQKDLVLAVEVTGALRSLESEQVGPPAEVPELWEFKIIRMVPEGNQVKAGDEVVAFDASELEKKLTDQENEVRQLVEELGKQQAEGALSGLSDRLEVESAEAEHRKAALKADKPKDLIEGRALLSSAVDRELSERELAFRKGREEARQRQAGAEAQLLRERLARGRGRVAETQRAIAALSVKARRAGTVVYKQNWRGEKKKVGDGLWRGDPVLEIASLSRMAAQGQVDEVDMRHVRVGQRVGLRLEAHPEREYPGVVERVASLIGTESPESRVKVVQLQLRLEETDPVLMRPGMRFRGRIEIARLPGVLQVPLSVVECTAEGPVVDKVGAGRTRVQLGRRGEAAVEIRGGLAPGDRVLPRRAEPGPVRLGPS